MTAIPLGSLGGQVSATAGEIGDLFDRFRLDAPSALAAVLVDLGGLPLVWTGDLPEESADHFAAVILGLDSLGSSAAQCFAGHRCERQLLELDREFLFVERVGTAGLLGVVADKRGDLGAVSYEVALLANRLAGRLDADVARELAGRVVRR